MSETLVALHVPASLYADMVAALALAMNNKPAVPAAAPAPPLLVPTTHLPVSTRPAPLSNSSANASLIWTREELHQLRNMVTTNKSFVTLIDLTIAKLGERVGFDEVCAQSGRSKDQAKGDLSAFTRLIHTRFGNDHYWPLEWIQTETGLVYWILPHIAEWWKE